MNKDTQAEFLNIIYQLRNKTDSLSNFSNCARTHQFELEENFAKGDMPRLYHGTLQSILRSAIKTETNISIATHFLLKIDLFRENIIHGN